MSCGCGCKGHGGKGSCMDVMSNFPKIGGVMPMAYIGYPSPSGYQGLNGLGCMDPTATNFGSGDPEGNEDCIYSQAAITAIETPIQTTYIPPPDITTPTAPSITPTPTNTTTTPSASVSSLDASLANAWTNIFGKILVSEAGANPTIQTIGPNGTSTTVYGSAANLQSALATTTVGGMSMGTLLLFAGVGIVVMMMVSKGK